MGRAAELAVDGSVWSLSGFALVTMWVHGPVSPFLPATYEPLLALAGRLHPPLAIAGVGAVASTIVEAVNLRLCAWLLRRRALERLRARAAASRVAGLFARSPFLAVWLCGATPLPDWGGRILAVVAGYPTPRYLVACLTGRFPKFWALAALGGVLPVSDGVLVAAAVIPLGVMAAVAAVRRARLGPAREGA